jgi:hypothetical protein
MSDEKRPRGRRSASAEAAALRRGKPEDEEPELPPHVDEAGEADLSGPRRSASAEAAALRYEREHPDDDGE